MNSFGLGVSALFFNAVLASMGVAQEQSIRPAKVADVVASDTTIYKRYPASVLPSREIELSFNVSGQVIELPVRAASNIEAGDVTAMIDGVTPSGGTV